MRVIVEFYRNLYFSHFVCVDRMDRKRVIEWRNL